jgi:hypothetical protein
MFDEDLRHDSSGMAPFMRDGTLHFIQRTAAIVCRKL